MKRQAIAISLDDLKKIENQLKKEIKDIEKLGIMVECDKSKLKMQLDIINYPTQVGKRTIHCSDTWEFEMLREEKKE